MKQKRYDRSAEFFRKVIDAVPDNVDAHRNLGLSMHMQGRTAEGVRELEDTIRKYPNSAESYNTLGLILADRGQKQEAAALFQKALSINPNFAQAQANLRKVSE
ncbi:MAG: tetratricopeptide repeat protein [Chloracidobacterium sp.]|nr:tetratricopeptide repeat protein [Chloracidobacterium sp.]